MASINNSNDTYNFQRPSAAATRSLISNSKPIEITSSSSNDIDVHAKQVLQRRTTNHYEQATAAATKADQIPATTAGSAAVSVADRPGMAKRQSWKMSDFKGQQQGQMLADDAAASGYGYSSTQK